MGDEQTKTPPINNQAALPPGRSVGGDLADVVCILTGLTCLTLVPQVSRSDGPARVFSSIQEARDDASSSRNRDIKDRFVSIGGKGFRCADTAQRRAARELSRPVRHTSKKWLVPRRRARSDTKSEVPTSTRTLRPRRRLANGRTWPTGPSSVTPSSWRSIGVPSLQCSA